ncbi:MAG: FAD-binding oxidoreductase [Anaerolineales bacterium]
MNPIPSFQTLNRLGNFGRSLYAPAYLYQPTSVEEIEQIFKTARERGLTIGLRGAGKSYNDAALNGGGIVLDLRRMNRILEWNPETGLIRLEPGVTIQQLWQHTLPDGWWPPVVSGTMTTTLGGCLAMNIHGKNNFRMGTLGEHVLEFTLLLPTGLEIICGPKKNRDLFYAAVGGLGMLGVFTTITLQMKKIHSGFLRVRAWHVPDLNAHLAALEAGAPAHDYIVGWLDATAGGPGLGRGQIHAADYLPEGQDTHPERSLRVDYQTLPSKFFGLVPKSLLHYFMAPFMNNLGAWAVNSAKYLLSLPARSYSQTHAAFHFLLDYVPDWELAYGRQGLIQYQSFLPKETARDAWAEMLTLSRRRDLPSYLGVTKRHRPDGFLLSHAVDGFSLALDFKVTESKRARLATMLEDFDRIALEAGGRFYFAKNSETSPETARRFLSAEAVAKFKALKKRCDPHHLLQSDLYRRLFGEQE